MSCSAYDYTEGDGGGNEKSGKSAPSKAAECHVGLVLNMQHAEPPYPNKKMNFMSSPRLSHHPEYGASIEFGGGNDRGGGGLLLFDNSTATSNQIASGSSSYTIGGEMKNMLFTASQLQEFENQTMIYKHIMSSNPVPPQLLLPLSTQSNRSDSEPWRCRRTDGKKWRCSRDVIPDQKYCERHAHKNRPRSRKPVETQSQNTKHLSSKDNYHPTLHPAPSMPTSCQQSRCTEWFMKSGTIPLSSSHQKIQKPMHSPSVGSKGDNFFQNLEGNHQDLVGGDNCLLTLMQPGGYDTCDDQEFFQMGIGMLNADGSNPHSQWTHQGSCFGGPLGGPLGEALCPGVASSLNRSPNVPSSHDAGLGLH